MENQPSHSKNVELRLDKKKTPKQLIGVFTKIMGGAFFYRTTDSEIILRPTGTRFLGHMKELMDKSNVEYKEETY